MVQISGYKFLQFKRGFTFVEITIVIALILVLAIPIGTLLMNYLKANYFESTYLKEQYYANVIMQDIEQRIRRADNGSVNFSNYTLTFSYTDANPDGSKKTTIYCVYTLQNAGTTNSIFNRGIGTSPNPAVSVFPVGLEKGLIRDFNITISTAPPYFAKVAIQTSSGFTLTNSIYLLNYGR
ncbi:MAG: PilW family protein [Caldisericum sp.]|uniref:PilW family protein n=1 Tax=Caldisericum sp. TaxID=2499687 RepID=UPI003D0E8AE0